MSVLDDARALYEGAVGAGLELRLLGGAAIMLRCPKAVAGGPYREVADLDAIVTSADGRRAEGLLQGLGFAADERFNAMHGDRRMIFHGPRHKLDLFVGAFEMCHKIPLEDRIPLEPLTLPLADLLITKLQVVELNEKDLMDITALVGEHPLAETGGENIDLTRLTHLVADDWGLWRTATGTLDRVAEASPPVAEAAGEIHRALDTCKKTFGFRMRARVGEKMRWYELPDEV